MYHQINPDDMYDVSSEINTKISNCPDCLNSSVVEHWYVKPEALGSIPSFGRQITFRNRPRFGLIPSSSIEDLEFESSK